MNFSGGGEARHCVTEVYPNGRPPIPGRTPDAVSPVAHRDSAWSNGVLEAKLKPLSWNVSSLRPS